MAQQRVGHDLATEQQQHIYYTHQLVVILSSDFSSDFKILEAFSKFYYFFCNIKSKFNAFLSISGQD